MNLAKCVSLCSLLLLTCQTAGEVTPVWRDAERRWDGQLPNQKVEKSKSVDTARFEALYEGRRDPYCFERKNLIRPGEPFTIIFNRVHIGASNSEFGPVAGVSTAEVAVVLTIDDGSGEEPLTIFVGFFTGIGDEVSLPFRDLLAYGTDRWDGSPIRLKISVIELDEFGDSFTGYLNQLTKVIDKATGAQYAGLVNTLNSVGGFLIKRAEEDDTVVEFEFQVYQLRSEHYQPAGIAELLKQTDESLARVEAQLTAIKNILSKTAAQPAAGNTADPGTGLTDAQKTELTKNTTEALAALKDTRDRLDKHQSPELHARMAGHGTQIQALIQTLENLLKGKPTNAGAWQAQLNQFNSTFKDFQQLTADVRQRSGDTDCAMSQPDLYGIPALRNSSFALIRTEDKRQFDEYFGRPAHALLFGQSHDLCWTCPSQ